MFMNYEGIWRTTRRTRTQNQTHNLLTVGEAVEMCFGRHLRKHLSQSTVLTVWILQALTVRHSTCSKNSRIWAEPQQEQNRTVQTKRIWDEIQKGFVVQQSLGLNQNLSVAWTHVHTSLVECEAGVVIATVSLFRAAGSVVLTAVAPDSWCWKTKPFILGLDWTQAALTLSVFVAAQTQINHGWHSCQRQEKIISLLKIPNDFRTSNTPELFNIVSFLCEHWSCNL